MGAGSEYRYTRVYQYRDGTSIREKTVDVSAVKLSKT